ncbi:DUF2452 domain-containing protein [Methylophilaceae bacterium]|nr:DUF2452 domain-containing protein [Methylophilaceae bacterium]
MGKKLKRPDNVTDLPASTPYPTNVGAPAFKLNNIVEFKETRSSNALNHLNTRLEEIKKQYDDLVKLAQDTEMVYQSRYGFIPIVGKTYHLYSVEHNDKPFLSIMDPDRAVWDYLGSFKFTTENIWERVDK